LPYKDIVHHSVEMTVRELGPDDWAVKRDLRLAALLDAPYAFSDTYARASARDESAWRDWPSGTAAVFGAFDAAGAAVGLAGAFEEDEPGLAGLFSMWVAPGARRLGVAGRLIDAVAGWAWALGRTGVLLEVTAGNDRADKAYRRYGFVDSDDPPTTEGGRCLRLRLADYLQ
jgi:GNAT superfamily N-acetyltransferase